MMTAALLALLLSQTPPAGAPLPFMDYETPSRCLRLPPSPRVPSGRYRMQCDEKTRRCLIAPEHELDPDGTESDRPLERVPPCVLSENDPPASFSEDSTLVPAIAEAPPGWYRDERGRVMQFNFDLHRRVWLGGAWAPLWRPDEPQAFNRGRVDFGIIHEIPSQDKKLMHRLTWLDTELVLGQQPSLDGTLLRYDTNVRRDTPPLWVTTFLGKPRRFDADLDTGFWMELLRVEWLRRGSTEALYYTLASTHLTLDLWHAKDLTSYVRVRVGPSLEYDRTHRFVTLVPGAAVEGDLTLDANGFHHLTFAAEAEKLFLGGIVEGRADNPERLRVRAGYELILLAINDQPLSLVVDGRGTWRDDLEGVDAGWEWSAHAGLRFSLWAPARRSAPLASAR